MQKMKKSFIAFIAIILIVFSSIILCYLFVPKKTHQKAVLPAVMFQNRGEHIENTELIVEGDWSSQKIFREKEVFIGSISTEALYYTEEKDKKQKVTLQTYECTPFKGGLINYFGERGLVATMFLSTDESHEVFVLQGNTLEGREGECMVIAPATTVEEAYAVWKKIGFAGYPDSNYDNDAVMVNGELYKKGDEYSRFEDKVKVIGSLKSYNEGMPLIDEQSNVESLVGADYGIYEEQLYVRYPSGWYLFRRVYDDMATFKAQGKVYHCTGVLGVVDEVVVLGNIKTYSQKPKEYPVEDNQCNEPDWVGAAYGVFKGKMYLYYCGEWLRCYEIETK
ncbi:MAG: hypothetical protein IJW63_05030 [Lachnospiraceae bacterium]|nr:hypothetical protein [Lachnospiraceae bacterium]